MHMKMPHIHGKAPVGAGLMPQKPQVQMPSYKHALRKQLLKGLAGVEQAPPMGAKV